MLQVNFYINFQFNKKPTCKSEVSSVVCRLCKNLFFDRIHFTLASEAELHLAVYILAVSFKVSTAIEYRDLALFWRQL